MQEVVLIIVFSIPCDDQKKLYCTDDKVFIVILL